MLFKKNHYSLAVNMAKNQNLGEEGLMEIFTQYGNHLYSKGDFDDAILQYVKTIGYLEPSYVIRKVCLNSLLIGYYCYVLWLCPVHDSCTRRKSYKCKEIYNRNIPYSSLMLSESTI